MGGERKGDVGEESQTDLEEGAPEILEAVPIRRGIVLGGRYAIYVSHSDGADIREVTETETLVRQDGRHHRRSGSRGVTAESSYGRNSTSIQVAGPGGRLPGRRTA